MVVDKNIQALRQLNVQTLSELKEVLSRLNAADYTFVNPKGKASVGQHVRHSLEMYLCLFNENAEVNYDARKRDITIEVSSDNAIATVDAIIDRLHQVELDRPILHLTELPAVSDTPLTFNSSLSRELFYVLGHLIHHMALMRILIVDEQPDFELTDSFGVAYSTLAYRDQLASD
ncbi:MAG: DinB family protein [Flavobacteriales bacterium]|nr:DinB family protein [Flavobacteriales bacterium]